MSDIRVIKKYPNRRLYDTRESRYITLNDIRQLVIDDEAFKVVDQKTGNNLTRCVLLHVIAEQEHQGEAVMNEDFLAQLIRAYSETMPRMVRRYLEESLSLLLRQQGQVGKLTDAGAQPLTEVADIAQQHLTQWLALQRKMLKLLQWPPARAVEDPALSQDLREGSAAGG